MLDKSGSMGFGEKISKLEYAKYLSASLAYMLLKQKDSVGLATFDEKIDQIIPPSVKRSNLIEILKLIDKAEPSNETSLSNVLYQLAQKTKKRGLIIIISDLLDDPTSVVKALRSFRYRKHEILVFHILDLKEYEFSFAKAALFHDLEDGSEMVIEPSMIRTSYQRKFKDLLQFYRHQLLESHIDYETIFTTTRYDRALFSYLQKRGRLK